MTTDPEEIRIDARDAALHALGITDLATLQRVTIDHNAVTVTRHRTGTDDQTLAAGGGPATIATTIGYTEHQAPVTSEGHPEIPAELIEETAKRIANTEYNEYPSWWNEISEIKRDWYRKQARAIAPLLIQAGRDAAAADALRITDIYTDVLTGHSGDYLNGFDTAVDVLRGAMHYSITSDEAYQAGDTAAKAIEALHDLVTGAADDLKNIAAWGLHDGRREELHQRGVELEQRAAQIICGKVETGD